MGGDRMKIILPDGKITKLDADEACIEEILRTLNINPVEVIVSKNGMIAPEEERASSEDELKIVRVVHGG
jgi:sulfur carrier protein ThiS